MSGSRGPQPAARTLSSSVLGVAIVAITGMQLMSTLDGTIVVVALPRMQAELALSDAGKSWVITAYVLTFGGLMLLGGRLGDTIGRKRTFIVGVALFTIASILCGIAWDEATLVIARLLQGVGAAIASPTGLALIATTFPKGPARNAATAIFAAMTGIGSVMGLVVGGALVEVSWRLAFLVNVPIGLLMIYLARTTLRETQRERMKLDAGGALLATLACTAAVFGFAQAPENGWLTPVTLISAGAALLAFVAFVFVERRAVNPVVPFALFRDRNRLATFAAVFLAGGVMFTLTVLIGLYVQDIMGYSALKAGIGFIPFVIALGIGLGLSSQLVAMFSPRVLVIAGGVLVLAAMIYGSTTFEVPDQPATGYLLIGDSASIPAIASIIEALPSEAHIECYLEEHDPADHEIPLPEHPGATVYWVPRQGPGSLTAAIPARDYGGWYAWVAPESGSLKALRPRLRNEFGFTKATSYIQAYWVEGKTMGTRRGLGESSD